MHIEALFDKDTSTLSYVVHDEATKDAIVIDPVLDFDPASGAISRTSAKRLVTYVTEKRLTVRAIFETHAHADHLSASQVLKEAWPTAPLMIGEGIRVVQRTFREIFGLVPTQGNDSAPFDRLLRDGETVSCGSLNVKVLATPGHTSACVSYLVGDAVFTGDVLFMPDSGTGRCDFPGGDARALYRSVTQRLYVLPDATRVFTGHDYQPDGRPLRFAATIGEQKRDNIHLKAATSEEEYVAFRTKRDATLKAPRLLYPSLQVNIEAGRLPCPEANGRRYLKLPLTED